MRGEKETAHATQSYFIFQLIIIAFCSSLALFSVSADTRSHPIRRASDAGFERASISLAAAEYRKFANSAEPKSSGTAAASAAPQNKGSPRFASETETEGEEG